MPSTTQPSLTREIMPRRTRTSRSEDLPAVVPTRTRKQAATLLEEPFGELDHLSDDELEEILFDDDEERRQGPFNLPAMAGLSLIVVGLVYLLQQLGLLSGFSLATLVAWLPWMAGVLIVLLGLGVLSRSPRRKLRRRARHKRHRRRLRAREDASEDGGKRRLRKSRDRMVAGICGGLAEYFNFSSTFVRLAVVVGTLLTPAIGPIVPIAYVILAFIMPRPAATESPEARIDSRDINIYR